MKVLFDGQFDYPDTNYYFYDWQDFEDGNMNLLYVYGIYGKDLPPGYKNRIYFNAEEPNGLYHSGVFLHERQLNGKYISNDWTKIYQLCPYSTRWLRDVIGDKRYDFLGHLPICSKKYYPDVTQPKIYDMFYQGSIHSGEISSALDIMKNYKYVWTSLSDAPDARKTHYKLPFVQKLQLQAQCKITVELNSLYEPYPGAFIRNVSRLPHWKSNEAFSHVEFGIMPQFKTRVLEDMLCKTLILAKKNEWKLMEEFGFVEGEHFIYFDSMDQLPMLINDCLNNSEYCEKITENAYRKVIAENSIEAVFNKYLQPYNV